MSATADIAEITYFLKEIFHDKMVEMSFPQKATAWGMLPKKQSWGGERKQFPLQYGDITGISAKFSVAQANKSPTKGIKFKYDTEDLPEDYAIFGVRIKAMRASKGKDAAWRTTVRQQVKSAIKGIARRNGYGIHRDPTGTIAKIADDATLGSGTTIKLTSRRQLHMINEGGYLQAYDVTGSAMLSGRVKVEAVHPNTPAITVDQVPTTAIPGLAAGDMLLPEGDYNGRFLGFDSWLPDTAPVYGSDSFLTVDRGKSEEKLGGVRYDADGKSYEEAVINAHMRNDEMGGEADLLLIDHDAMNDLVLLMQGRTENTRANAQANDGQKATTMYSGIKFMTPYGMLEAYTDHYQPEKVAWLLQKDTWCFWSMGPTPGFLNDLESDSGYVVEKTDAAYEGRIGQFGDLICDAPGWNVRIQNFGGDDSSSV